MSHEYLLILPQDSPLRDGHLSSTHFTDGKVVVGVLKSQGKGQTGFELRESGSKVCAPLTHDMRTF